MTLFADARKQAMRDALTLMLAAIGEHAFDEVFHDVRHDDVGVAPFEDVPWTAWADLEARACVRPRHSMGRQTFALTGAGWIAALEASLQLDTPEQMDRVHTLRRALVDANTGRPPQGTLVSLSDIVEGTGLRRGWVTNAVQSQLLALWFKGDHMALEIERGVIRIPSRFGAGRLDLDSDE